jgi:hypothetical protein
MVIECHENENFCKKIKPAAAGTTASRTRLYQMGIAKVWEEIKVIFEIQDYINED